VTGWLWRRLRCLRYLLVWPVILAYRRRARRSLRWRLTGSHLLTLLIGLATALSLVGLLSAILEAIGTQGAVLPGSGWFFAGGVGREGAEGRSDPSRSSIAPAPSGPRRSQFAVQPAEHFRSTTPALPPPPSRGLASSLPG
jgi:hypothetical protein